MDVDGDSEVMVAERPRVRRALSAGALLSAGTGILLLVAFAGLLPLNHIFNGPYRLYRRVSRDFVSLEEAVLFAGVVFLAAPAALLLTRALVRPGAGLLERLLSFSVRRERWTLAACLAVALAGTVASGFFLVQQAPLTDEQQGLLFQADLLRAGHLSVPEPRLLHGVELPAIWQRNGQWTEHGQWGHAVVLAAGDLLGSPFILPTLVAPLLVLLTWLIMRELYPGDRAARVVAAALLASSPFLLFTSATLSPATSSAAAILLGAYALLRHVRGGSVAWALLAGLAFGFDLHVRPVNGAALGGVCAGLALLARARERRSPVTTILGLAAGLVPAALAFWQLHRLGFDVYIPVAGSLPTVASLGRSASDLLCFSLWTSGSALTATAIVAACAGVVRARADWLLLVPVAVLFAAIVGWDRGPEVETGPAAYLEVLPFVAMFLGRVAAEARTRLAPAGRRALATGAAVSMLVALVTFWPVQAAGLHATSEQVIAPYRLVADIGLPKSFVLWYAPEPRQSWVTQPRPPSPDGADTVLFLPSEERDWLERALGGKKHVQGRRPYYVLQDWGNLALLSWKPPVPPSDEEPLCRPELSCELEPNQSR